MLTRIIKIDRSGVNLITYATMRKQ